VLRRWYGRRPIDLITELYKRRTDARRLPVAPIVIGVQDELAALDRSMGSPGSVIKLIDLLNRKLGGVFDRQHRPMAIDNQGFQSRCRLTGGVEGYCQNCARSQALE
jgi:hypothetical protein